MRFDFGKNCQSKVDIPASDWILRHIRIHQQCSTTYSIIISNDFFPIDLKTIY